MHTFAYELCKKTITLLVVKHDKQANIPQAIAFYLPDNILYINTVRLLFTMSESEIITRLKQQGRVWSGNQCYSALPHKVIPTSYELLDEHLPGGGWPVGGVVEIQYPHNNMGELRIVLPALKYLKQQDKRWQIWLNPPGQPHGPGLASWGVPLDQTLICMDLNKKEFKWTLDQCVQHNGCSALLAWTEYMEPAQLRRLQLASETRDITVFLFRPIKKANNLSYTRLKLQVAMAEKMMDVRVDILKRRPGWPVHGLEFHVPLFGSEWK